MKIGSRRSGAVFYRIVQPNASRSRVGRRDHPTSRLADGVTAVRLLVLGSLDAEIRWAGEARAIVAESGPARWQRWLVEELVGDAHHAARGRAPSQWRSPSNAVRATAGGMSSATLTDDIRPTLTGYCLWTSPRNQGILSGGRREDVQEPRLTNGASVGTRPNRR